ncbi:MAG TPA: T9SS type A sorting domain-containing protein [Edaphocola sp.]|nr:T9SS type A sorting domain-containing protein [Edaphocola sp.]
MDSLIKIKVQISFIQGEPAVFYFNFNNGNLIPITSTFNSDDCVKDSIIWSGHSLKFQGYDETQATQGFGNYRIFYRQINGSWANCANDLRKPVIIVDGFDPGDERKIIFSDDKPGIWDLLKYNNDNKHLGDELRKKGYDVIILNFPLYKSLETNQDRDGGADYIERNAMVLVRLIQVVNQALQASGSTEKIVLVGPSMGGQIARYALAYMEKQQNLGVANMNHNTRLYVSFDSPHLGANIPLSLQKSIYTLGYKLNKKNAKESYDIQLRSKAARQMLIEQTDGVNGTASFFTEYYNNNLINNGLQGSNGWPLNLRKIALINGNARGIKNGIAGTEILNMYAGNFIKVIEIKASSMPNYGNEVKPLFKVKGFGNFLTTIYATYSQDLYNYNNRGSMDIMPGGTFNTSEFLYNQVKKTTDSLNISTILNVLQPSHCFIPSISSLAFKNSNFNWSNSFNDYNLVCNNEIPFDNYFTAPTNEEHVHLSEKAAHWVMEEIEYGQIGCPTICATALNGIGDRLCFNQTTTVSLNAPLSTNATVLWEASNDVVFTSPPTNTSNAVTIKSIADNPTAFVKATITTHNANGEQCAGNTVLQANFRSGNNPPGGIALVHLSNTCQFQPKFNAPIDGNSYYWSLDGINYISSGDHPESTFLLNVPADDGKVVYCKVVSTCGTTIFNKMFIPLLPNGISCPVTFSLNKPAVIPLFAEVYPNPTSDYWTVQIPRYIDNIFSFTVNNVEGKRVYAAKDIILDNSNYMIDAKSFNKGIYILKIMDKYNQEVCLKLIKQE